MVDDPFPAVRTNIVGGLNVLEAVRTHEVPAVFISLGNYKMNNTYSITKSTVERFVAMYNKEHDTSINIVRAMNAYGPGQKPPYPYGYSRVRKIVPTFICRALRNEPIEVYGDGQQISDMVYVTDVADVLVKALMLASNDELVNPIEVGPAVHNTVMDIANLVIEVTGSESEITLLPRRPGEDPSIPVYAEVISMTRAGIDPGEFVSLEDGMAMAVDFYKDKYGP
jgi:UDP-glucose 4-epimerase